MGYSNPKKPFDLKDFLSKKGTPRRNPWKPRPPTAPAQKTAAPEPETPPEAASTE